MKNKEQIALRKQYTSQFYKNNYLAFLVSLAAAFLISIVNLVMSWLIQQIVDTVSGVRGAFEIGTLAYMTVGVIICILAFEALSYVSRPRFIRKAMQQYKVFAFSKLMQKTIASFNDESAARYISAFSNDASSIEANYLDSLFNLILNGVLFIGSLAMMLIYSSLLTVIACAFFIPPIIVSLIAGKKMEPAERKISEKNEGFIATLKDCLSGFPVIKSFRAENAIITQFMQVSNIAEQSKCDKRKIATIVSALSGITGVAAQFGTFLVGGWLVLSGHDISVGALFIFLDLTANVINPIRELPTLLSARKAALGLIDKLAEEMENNLRDEGQISLTHLKNGIKLKNVFFGYESDKQVLQNINCSFELGKKYAIVGASGSGKSTLLNLLMASYQNYEGSIYYDDTELREINSSNLYEMESIIQQNVFVFNATIRDNITMSHNFPEDEISEAIRLSGLSAVIEEKGADYLCGENGSGLSGGEKQRISIARSLLRKSSVLLVDEATAALDAKTAYCVTDSILNLEGLTRVVVTHALDKSLLSRYDAILVLKDGRLVEMGTFQELIARQKYFYSLYTISQ